MEKICYITVDYSTLDWEIIFITQQTYHANTLNLMHEGHYALTNVYIFGIFGIFGIYYHRTGHIYSNTIYFKFHKNVK